MTPRPRAVIAFSLRPDGTSGVQTHTRVLRQGLADAGVACSLVTPFSGGRRWLPVFAVRPLLLAHLSSDWSTRWHRHWHFVAVRQNLLRHLSREPVDLVITQCATTANAALQVRRALGRHFPIALVCHFTVSEAEELLEKGVLRDERALARIADDERRAIEGVDLVIHDSAWQRSSIEGHRGLRPRASTVIWHGIAPDARADGEARTALGYSPDDVVLVNVGTLEPRKNQLGLIDAFAHLAAHHPQAKLLLVGGDGVHRRAIERRIESGGLTGRVRLLVDWPDVPSVLAGADVYVHYATIESFGLVLLEAARAGLPVAAVPVGGSAEVLDRLGGIPLPAGDAEGFRRALQPLLEQRPLRTQLGIRARRSFLRYFTQQTMVASYLRVLGLDSESEPSGAAGEPIAAGKELG